MNRSRTALFGLLSAWLVLGTACKRAEKPAPQPPRQQQRLSARAPAALTQSTLEEPTGPLVEIARPEEPQLNWRALLEELGPPSLLVLQQANGRCEWSVLRPPELAERLFLVTYICPSGLAWDRKGGRALFSLEGILYLHDWQNAQVEELGASPIAEPEFGFSANGVLRACEYQTLPDERGTTAVFRITLERQEDGSWNRTAFEKLGYEPTSEPCSGLGDAEMTGGVLYNPRFQQASNCPLENRPAGAVCPGKEAIDALSAQVKREHDGFEYIAFSPSSFVAYPVAFGQSTTRLAPVFTIEDDAVTPIYDRQPPTEQWDVLLGTDYFLVRAEVELSHATLFKKGQAQPVKEFADDASVIWIPGTIPTADVIELTPEVSGDEE